MLGGGEGIYLAVIVIHSSARIHRFTRQQVRFCRCSCSPAETESAAGVFRYVCGDRPPVFLLGCGRLGVWTEVCRFLLSLHSVTGLIDPDHCNPQIALFVNILDAHA